MSWFVLLQAGAAATDAGMQEILLFAWQVADQGVLFCIKTRATK